MISLIPTFAVIALPAKYRDIITYAFYVVIGVLFLCAVAFAVWGGLSLERREEAMLKMKGCLVSFAMVSVIAAIFDAMGWSTAIGISFTGL